jgi:hypothetical protein
LFVILAHLLFGAKVLVVPFGKALPTEKDMNGKGVIDRREWFLYFLAREHER